MKRLELRDTLEFRQGRAFEQGYARQCIQSGLGVMRCYDLNVDSKNKAPIMEGMFKGLRLPDLQVFMAGKTEWRECKEKSRASFTYSECREDHGIGLACYYDYLEVQRKSGFPVKLVIGEWETKQILIQSLDILGLPRTYTGKNMPQQEHMAFWPRKLFDLWGHYPHDPTQADLPLGLRPKTREIRYSPQKWQSGT